MIENTIWVEKYRPTSLDTFIGNELTKQKLQSFIDNQDIPHLLFAGPPGCGKTTAAKILMNSIKCDYLFINASDENSVDTIRNKIKGFVTTIGFSPLKIVVLDESDFLSPNGQSALRNLMETFSKHSRFILTCNYVERIIDPILSRCQSLSLIPPSQKEVAVHLSNLLKTEGVSFSPEDLKTLVVSYHPDVRKIINTAQLFSKDNRLMLDINKLIASDVKLMFMSELLNSNVPLNKRFKTIREGIHKNGVKDFSEFFTYVFENIDNFPESKHPNIILEIAEAQARDAYVVDKEINFAALTYKLLEILK